MYTGIKLQTGKGEPKPKMGKLAPKARKPQAVKNGPKKPSACDRCEWSFNCPAELKRHIDMVHLGLKPYKCSECDAAYGHKGDLNKHIKAVHEGAFVCPTCNKSFTSNQNMAQHIAAVHEGIRHNCDFCETTSSTKSYLNAHIKKFHPK